MKCRSREGLQFLRLVMVFSSFSPLFILLAIRGTDLISDYYFVTGCLAVAILPTLFLLLREHTARKENDTRLLTVGKVEDHRGHVLVYLFAILLPFYRQDIDGWRDLGALLAALVFIIFLFWHLNFHYMNIVFAIRRYRIWTIYPSGDTRQYSSLDSFTLITRRSSLSANQSVVAYRLTNTLYLEKEA
ncbi:MAG: hypothetical protein F4X94_04330 [Dehalococcoidia bacterium]|nr:hypothetical protein [Dehalococcoidia bacterium]